MKFYENYELHLDSEEISSMELEPLILGALIKIDNSSSSSPNVSSISPANAEDGESGLKNQTRIKSISRLKRYIDPNIGLTGYLPSLNMTYETKMNQPWNIAPYFLDILTQSPCCDLSDCILLFGGLDPTHPEDFVLGSSVFEYHIKHKKWRYYGCMLEPRCYHGVAQTKTSVYVTGGYSMLQRAEGEMIATASTHRLDITNTLWHHCADMKTARASHAMVAVDECLYVFGGRDSNGDALTSVEMYDPIENCWTEISHLPVPLMGLSATYVRGKIWLVGGITSHKPDHENASVVATVYSFSPANKSWCSEEPLPGPHAFASVVSNEDSICVAGGSHFSKSIVDKTLISCPCLWQLSFLSRTKSWNKIGYLPIPTHAGTSVMCGDLLVSLGGIHSLSQNGTNAVQVFNTKTKSFEQSEKLPAKIVGGSAVYFPPKTLADKSLNGFKSSTSKNEDPKLQQQSTVHEGFTPSQESQDSGVTHSSYASWEDKNFAKKDSSIQDSVESHGMTDKFPPSHDVPETSIYARELSAPNSRKYVTTLEIPLNGEIIFASEEDSKGSDFTETEPESSGSSNFKLYSPPPKWKERSKRYSKNPQNH